MKLRSISFDTSFLLKDTPEVRRVLHLLKRDNIPCFITATAISELELLKVWKRIDRKAYNKAMGRWKHLHSRVIALDNNLLSRDIKAACTASMQEHHGVSPEDIVNDCSILVTGLKNGIDIFLSEDYHFTSRVTDKVMEEVTGNACREYSSMCDEEMYMTNSGTFLEAYDRGEIDLEKLHDGAEDVRKPGKRLSKGL